MRLNIIFIFWCFASFLKSQTFPVSITTQLTPPFSGFVPDYSSAGNDKLKVLMLFNDFTKPSYNVKLKIKIDGQGITIQSKPFYFEGPFTLEPGVPMMIGGSDFGGLLNTNNLDFSGITKVQYEQRKVLPEGFYSICITAYDYNNPNNIVVSNISCAYGMMILSDPPYLNTPSCGGSIATVNPQQITFNWTPVNQGSPNSAFQTDYVFELFEVRPPNQNPNNIVQTLPPIFTETTSLTSLNYGITEPPLINAMQYVWRVRAVDQSGRDVFKNNGYSQVCTFTWGSAYTGASLNINLTGVPVSHRQIKCTWDSLNLYQNYKLEFQKVNGTPNWFPLNTANARAKISSLEPNTEYKIKVSGELPDNSWGPPSNEITVRTPAAPVYNCGDPVQPINFQNFVPLKSASVGMIWEIGQFEVLVLGIDNSMSSIGQYTGKGRVMMGFAGTLNFPVTFTNVIVNADMQIVAGKVNVKTKGIDTWLSQNNVGYFLPGDESTEFNTSSTNPNITVNMGAGTFNAGGQTYTFDQTYGNTITDGNGNMWVVTPNGSVINVGNANGPPIPPNKKYLTSAVGTAFYKESSQQLYGYDQFLNNAWSSWYEKTVDVTMHSELPVDWKSIYAKKYDIVDLTVQLNNANLKADSVFIRSASGSTFRQQQQAGKRFFYIVGSEEKKSQELFACIKMGDSIVNIGKLNTINYGLKEKVLNIVPLNNSASLNANALQARLNKVYRQAITSWKVNVKPTFTVQTSDWDIDNNNRLNCGSGLFTKYSKEMIKLNAKLRLQNYYNDQEFYIICSGTPPDSLSNFLQGEMPRARNIGYAFTNGNTNDSTLAKILSHELGHGAGTLEHTFPGLTQGSTNNLMDYVIENKTARFQWDLIQEPNGLAGVFDSDEDGQMNEADKKERVLQWLSKTKTAYKNNSTYTIPSETYFNAYIPKLSLNGILYDYVKVNVNFISAVQTVSPKNKIAKGAASHYYAYNNTSQTVTCVDVDGGKLKIEVPEDKIDDMISYLKTTPSSKNMILFVGGYRPIINFDGSDYVSIREYENSSNEVTLSDIKSYWKGIDASFIERIGTKNAVYADGHFGVYTANHLTVSKFASSMLGALRAQKAIVDVAYNVFINGNLAFIFERRDCYHVDSCVHLNTDKNTAGFSVRKSSGASAGYDMINKINNGTFVFNKQTDTLDIVAHSMGYAYALGMIQALKGANIHFGRFYIIAPENACTDGADWSMFQEVWQYGSNYDQPNPDPKWDQDGVAPQCECKNITSLPASKGGRVFIPNDVKKGFMDSHTISNYNWIFNKGPNDKGYVKTRK